MLNLRGILHFFDSHIDVTECYLVNFSVSVTKKSCSEYNTAHEFMSHQPHMTQKEKEMPNTFQLNGQYEMHSILRLV